MNKVILEMNDPERCYYCPLARRRASDDRYVCGIGHQRKRSSVLVYELIDIDSKTKPDWCPLKKIPEKYDLNSVCHDRDYDCEYEYGYNACIDEIVGEET